MLSKIKKGSSTYAVYDLSGQTATLDRVSLMMINHNQNQEIGLAPITLEEINGHYTNMLFDVTGRITLREYIGRNLTQDDFRMMLLHLIGTLEQLDEYMIDAQQLLLNLDAVYINAMDQSIAFLCVALKEETQSNSLYRFFAELVTKSFVQPNAQGINYFNPVYNIIMHEDEFSLQNIKKALGGQNALVNTGAAKTSGDPSMSGAEQQTERLEEPLEVTVTPRKQEEQRPVLPPVTEPVKEETPKKGFPWFSSKPKKKKSSESAGFATGIASMLGDKKSAKSADAAPQQAQQSPPQAPAQSSGGMAQFAQGQQPSGGMAQFAQGQQPSGGMAQFAQGQQPAGGMAQFAQGQQPSGGAAQFGQAHMEFGGTSVLKNGMAKFAPQQNQPAQGNMQSDAGDSGTVMLNFDNPPPQKGGTVKLELEKPAAAAPVMQAPAVQPPVNPPGMPDDGKTVMLAPDDEPDDGKTVMLMPDSGTTTKGYLIRLTTHERIELNKPMFTIGRNLAYLDYNVQGNRHVGHKHAVITERGGAYYITDLNSVNHTFVNGTMLAGNVETPLSDGDAVRLADEEFEFRLM